MTRQTACKKRIRAIVCDLDQTLLGAEKRISPGNLAAIRAAQRAGILVSICSGRVATMMESYIKTIGICGPVITANGAVLVDAPGGEVLWGEFIKRSEAIRFMDISTYIVWKFLGLGMLPTVLIAAGITALYWGIFSTMLIKPTQKITNADFTIAHQQMLADYVAYKLAPKLGDPEKDDIEKKKLPSSLNFLQDNIIATALVMFLSVVVIFLVIGGDQINWLRSAEGLSQAGLKSNVIFVIWTSLILTADIVVLLSGVRMFVGELMLSFKGISEKLLPGAVAGVDCAALFAFAPKSVVLGLIFGAVGQIVGLLLLLIFKSPIFLVPGFIPLFFDNATISIYANKFGGWKASALIVTVHGIIQILGSALAIALIGLTWWQGSGDYATIWVGIMAALKAIGAVFGIPIAG